MNTSNKEYIISGPKLLEDIPTVSYGRTIYNYLQNNSKLPIAMIDCNSKKNVSFKTLIQQTSQLAQSLQNFGVTQNDTIAISSENSIIFPLPFIAGMWLGATITLFNPQYTLREVLHVTSISKPNIIFCTKLSLPTILKIHKELKSLRKVIVMDGDSSQNDTESMQHFILRNLSDYVGDFSPVDVDSQRIGLIVYSSGTTGLPKGVMLTHYNLHTSLIFLKDPRYFPQSTPGTVVDMCLMPFFHAFGMSLFIIGLLLGRTCLVMLRFDGATFLKALEDYNIKSVAFVPPIANFLATSNLTLQYNVSKVEQIRSGSAPLSQHTQEALLKRFKNVSHISQGYGMTEATLVAIVTPMTNRKKGSIGRVMPGTLAKIIDTSTGKSLGAGEKGEICVKGPQIMNGYCGDALQTKQTIDEKGWLHTGDLGYYDEEEYFYIVDRLKELIKYKAFQVAPAELEAILMEHPKIVDAAVVGVPDEIAGELPMAFIVKQSGQVLTEHDVQKFVAAQVSSFKRLRGGVRFVTEIPKNPSGKILRNLLRQEVLHRSKL